MEIKVILWIIIGLFYLISRFRKKAAEQRRQQQPREMEPEAPDATKPMTFEELLREIEGSKKPPEPQPYGYEEPEQEPKSYEYEPVTGKKALEDVNYDYRNEDKIYETYERARQMAFERPSLEETVKLEDTVVRFKEFKPYESRKRSSLANDYVQELKNPTNFRKAFILSEILGRKF